MTRVHDWEDAMMIKFS
jgi:hypothetical protein